MPNLRIISDNALDRAATFTATSTNANYPSSNMLTDVKSDSWRTTAALTSTIRATWVAPEKVGAVIFPFCNFSPTAVIRVRATNELSTTNYCFYSEQFHWATWGKSGGTISADAVVAPNGTATADRFTASNNDGYLVQGMAGLPTTVPMVASVWMKSTVNRNINLYFGGGQVNVVVTTEWQRFFVNCAPIASAAASFQISGGGALQTGGILDVWGAQVQVGLAPDSYYPTPGNVPAVRPAGYMDDWQAYLYNSGYGLACPAPALVPRGFTAGQAAGAYAYGGGACARAWLPPIAVTGVSIDIADPDNKQGFMEVARAVVGPYWSPTCNASAASMTFVDTANIDRTDAGGQIADAGHIYKRVPIDLSMMPAADRATCSKILRNSRVYPIFLSIFPESDDLELERDNTVYGRRTADSDIAIENSIYYGTKIQVEEI